MGSSTVSAAVSSGDAKRSIGVCASSSTSLAGTRTTTPLGTSSPFGSVIVPDRPKGSTPIPPPAAPPAPPSPPKPPVPCGCVSLAQALSPTTAASDRQSQQARRSEGIRAIISNRGTPSSEDMPRSGVCGSLEPLGYSQMIGSRPCGGGFRFGHSPRSRIESHSSCCT